MLIWKIFFFIYMKYYIFFTFGAYWLYDLYSYKFTFCNHKIRQGARGKRVTIYFNKISGVLGHIKVCQNQVELMISDSCKH